MLIAATIFYRRQRSMLRVARVPLLATAILAAVPLAAQQPARWVATWAPSVFAAPPRPGGDSVDRVPTWNNHTIRQIARATIGGDRVRIRFTNEFGDRPLVIGSAQIALRDTGASIRTGTSKAVTFGGHPGVTLRRGAIAMSDPVDMRVPDLTDLAISIWIRDTIRASTRHPNAYQTNYVSPIGDFTAVTAMRADTTTGQWSFLAGIEVETKRATGVIVAFGNSITDGAGSPADSNGRWPDVLARRLFAGHEPPKAVVNAGIGGNGVIRDITGPAALARFDRDVLMQPGITHIILLEGINDLGRGAAPTNPFDSTAAEDIIYGYQQLIARAHERGVFILGATLTPMGNMTRSVTPLVNGRRKTINTWIRSSGAFDGVIDFDAATRDPANPDAFLPAYDSGDHLHPSLAGYKAMGESIDLALFRRTKPGRRP